jgi:hypothetical protein
VDGHRRYADEPEPSWYTGQSKTPYPASAQDGQNPYDSGVHERPSGAFRLPEQRESDYAAQPTYGAPDPMTSTGSHSRAITDTGAGSRDSLRMPVRGPEYPAVRPTSSPSTGGPPPATYGSSAALAPDGPAASLQQPTTAVPPVGRFPDKPADRVYRTRRPLSAVVVAVVMALLMLPTLMLLADATFGGDPLARNIVPAVLLTLGLPLTGVGLYALAAGGPAGREVWLRPPIAYLPVGLVLLLAAGLAVA